jgi:hypothetical protein
MGVKVSSSSISSCPRGGGEGGTQNDDDVQDGKTGKNFDAEEKEEDDRDVGYFCDDSDDDDSIYRRRRGRGGQKSKPTWMEMFFNCVSCKQCVCLACVIVLILLAVTIGKSALRDQRSKRHTGVDEFGRKIDQDGNVVHGRRAMMGIMDDDDGDVTLPSYPEWIAKHCGWLLYLLALVYTLLGFRVLCGSGGQKENDAFLKKALDAVAFDLTFWLPRKVNDSWIFDGPEQEIDVQKYEEEQYLPHEKANSCSRVSLILFFSVLFSFANPSTFRGYPYVGVSMVFGIGLYNFTIVPAMMLLKKRKERETKKKSRSSSGGGGGDDDDVDKGKVVLLWSSESVSSQYSMSNLTRDFCFYVFAMLALALFVARDAMFIIDDDEVNSANATATAAEDDDITRFVLAKNTNVYSLGWRCGVWMGEIYATYVVFRRIWVLFGTYHIRWKKGREEKRAECAQKKKEKNEKKTSSVKKGKLSKTEAPSSLSSSSSSSFSSVAIPASSKGVCTPASPPRSTETMRIASSSVSLEPPPPILVAERGENDAVRVSSPPSKKASISIVNDIEEREQKEEHEEHEDEEREKKKEEEEEEEEEEARDAEKAEVNTPKVVVVDDDENDEDEVMRNEQEVRREEKEEPTLPPPRSSFVELSFAKKKLLKIERALSKPWVFLFNLTIPSCPERKLRANEMSNIKTENDNNTTNALPSFYFDDGDDSNSDWLSDSSYDSVTDICVKIERKKCKRRVLSIACGTTWLAILSYAAVEFVTHLCNIYVQEYNEQIPSIFGGGGGNGELINKNNISKGSFESFIGSVVLSFLLSQSADVHGSYFLDAIEAKETATTPGSDAIFRVALFDTLFNIGMPFCLVLPFYKRGDYNMEVPRNQTMNAAFFAAIGAAMIYYLVARVSMKMVVNKSDGVSSSAELMLAWMFVLTYIVAVGAIGVVTFTNVI